MLPSFSIADYSKISPTAKLVAYSRQFSDIPFAQEVTLATHADEIVKHLFSGTNIQLEDIQWMAPLLEARYKGLFYTIKRLKIKQVLEIASGISFRGLAMSNDPQMIYVESDLPGIMEEKKQIINHSPAMQKALATGRVYFHTVNALSYEDIKSSLQYFDKTKPIAIVHEGLYQYLSFEEKHLMAQHIHRILKIYNGVWITPDFHTAQERERYWNHDSRMATFLKVIGQATQRDLAHNEFINDEHIEKFFGDFGFHLEAFPQIDGSFELTSLKKISFPKNSFESLIQNLRLWVLSIPGN